MQTNTGHLEHTHTHTHTLSHTHTDTRTHTHTHIHARTHTHTHARTHARTHTHHTHTHTHTHTHARTHARTPHTHDQPHTHLLLCVLQGHTWHGLSHGDEVSADPMDHVKQQLDSGLELDLCMCVGHEGTQGQMYVGFDGGQC